MQVRIHYNGETHDIEAPEGARVVQTSGEDCLVYRFEGRTEYLLTPFAVMCARAGTKGLRLIREEGGSS
jgi:hypothetical protein